MTPDPLYVEVELEEPLPTTPRGPGGGEVIRIQRLDGTWETLGLSRDPHIPVESIQATANEWGPDQLTCTLQRDPAQTATDLSTWTPCELEVDGIRTWEGRIKEAPKQGGAQPSVSLIGEGWQTHLDDDLNENSYVHTNLSEWQDVRSSPSVALGQGGGAFPVSGQVSTDSGITLMWPKDEVVALHAKVGVQLDMGPVARASRVVVHWFSSNNSANVQLVIRGSPVADAGSQFGGYTDAATGGTTPGTTPMAGTFGGSTHRYVSVFLDHTAGGIVGVAGQDVYVKLFRILVFTDAAYESGNESALTASTVIKKELDRSTILLSSDRSQIATTSLKLPSLDFRNEPRTPRSVISDLNNLHNYRAKIVDGRVPYFQPLPSSPAAVVQTSDLGVDWHDSSSGSSENIVNRVIVTGNDGSGQPVRIEKTASELSGVPLLAAPGVSFPNPTAATVLTPWTDSSGTVSRTTVAGEFDTAPAGFKDIPMSLITGVASSAPITSLTGTFKAGVNYIFQWRHKGAASGALVRPVVWATSTGGQLAQGASIPATGSFVSMTFSWIPSIDAIDPWFQLIYSHDSSAAAWFFDSLSISTAVPTLADRRGFKRTQVLQVGSPIDPGTADQLATLYLQARSITPFKGDVTINSPDAATDPKSGRPIRPQEFIRLTMESLRFGDLVDPDYGSMGRDGIIRAATYQNGSVQLTIDNTNRSLEALMARMAVVQGG